VYQEWKTVASAFPWLSLICQLFPCEATEIDKEEAKTLVQFSISNGQVKVELEDLDELYPDTKFDTSKLFLMLAGPRGHGEEQIDPRLVPDVLKRVKAFVKRQAGGAAGEQAEEQAEEDE